MLRSALPHSAFAALFLILSLVQYLSHNLGLTPPPPTCSLHPLRPAIDRRPRKTSSWARLPTVQTYLSNRVHDRLYPFKGNPEDNLVNLEHMLVYIEDQLYEDFDPRRTSRKPLWATGLTPSPRTPCVLDPRTVAAGGTSSGKAALVSASGRALPSAARPAASACRASADPEPGSRECAARGEARDAALEPLAPARGRQRVPMETTDWPRPQEGVSECFTAPPPGRTEMAPLAGRPRLGKPPPSSIARTPPGPRAAPPPSPGAAFPPLAGSATPYTGPRPCDAAPEPSASVASTPPPAAGSRSDSYRLSTDSGSQSSPASSAKALRRALGPQRLRARGLRDVPDTKSANKLLQMAAIAQAQRADLAVEQLASRSSSSRSARPLPGSGDTERQLLRAAKQQAHGLRARAAMDKFKVYSAPLWPPSTNRSPMELRADKGPAAPHGGGLEVH